MITVKKDVQGVGSNFLRLLDWLWYAKYSNDEVYIDWRVDGVDLLSNILSYKNPELSNNSKLYDHYVGKFSGLDENVINKRRKDVPFYDKYSMLGIGVKNGFFYGTPEVYFEKDFCLFREVFHNIFNQSFSLTDNFKNSLLNKTTKTLGVHIRAPFFYRLSCHNGPHAISQSPPSFFADCAKFVQEKFVQEKFETLYVACDIEDFYIALSNYFQDNQIIKIKYNRLVGNVDWGSGNRNIYDTVYNTYLDIFNLSRCDKLICASSNLVLTSLIINKDLGFEFFPQLKSLHTG